MPEFYSPENNESQSFDPNIEPQRIISIDKFIILSVVSFGLYEVWWMYKAWKFFKQKENNELMPALRAIFSIIFLYQLLIRILAFAQEKGYETEYPSLSIYVCFVLTRLLSRLPEPLFLLSLVTFVFLLPPFRAFNHAIRNSPEVRVEEQANFSVRQIFVILGGLFLWTSLIMNMTGQLGTLPVD